MIFRASPSHLEHHGRLARRPITAPIVIHAAVHAAVPAHPEFSALGRSPLEYHSPQHATCPGSRLNARNNDAADDLDAYTGPLLPG